MEKKKAKENVMKNVKKKNAKTNEQEEDNDSGFTDVSCKYCTT